MSLILLEKLRVFQMSGKSFPPMESGKALLYSQQTVIFQLIFLPNFSFLCLSLFTTSAVDEGNQQIFSQLKS